MRRRTCTVSTCWRSGIIPDARELIDTLHEAGADSIELEFRIKSGTFEEIRKNRKEWGVKITSLHAVCPSPKGKGRGAEAHLISDENEDARKKGVEDIRTTLRNAVEVEAGAVVIHAGRVPMDEPFYIMMNMYDNGSKDSPRWHEFLHAVMLERMAKSKRSFSQTLKSLEEINEEAVKLGINVGVENRYYFGEMPNIDEFGVIFNTFDGGRLYFWHDVGHAHVQEVLYGTPQRVMLETFGDRLIGMHLHDVQGGYTDHNEPGSGAVDFKMIKQYLKPDTIKVVELNQRVSQEELKRGIDYLADVGILV